MNKTTGLVKVITQTLQFLGYSESLIKKTLTKKKKIIAIRYYKIITKMVPISNNQSSSNHDIESINELVRENVEQAELDRIFLETTKEVINEYFEEISKK